VQEPHRRKRRKHKTQPGQRPKKANIALGHKNQQAGEEYRSQNTPNNTLTLAAPALTTFTISATLTAFMSPICVMPILSENHAGRFKDQPGNENQSNLVILQIL